MGADGAVGPEAAGSFSLTLDRGLRLLDLLARPENAAGMTVTALAASLGMSRTAAYRLLGTLESHGYVGRLPDGR
ncbi:MAG TPA: helix-turn-helix domain-containing protein, partial [Lapillicoccus sp.]